MPVVGRKDVRPAPLRPRTPFFRPGVFSQGTPQCLEPKRGLASCVRAEVHHERLLCRPVNHNGHHKKSDVSPLRNVNKSCVTASTLLSVNIQHKQVSNSRVRIVVVHNSPFLFRSRGLCADIRDSFHNASPHRLHPLLARAHQHVGSAPEPFSGLSKANPSEPRGCTGGWLSLSPRPTRTNHIWQTDVTISLLESTVGARTTVDASKQF